MALLVITSTVYVNSGLTVLTDPSERIKQYVESIKFYLCAKMIDRIVVCDNSNYDYTVHPEFSNTDKEIEFLTFVGNGDKIREKGKGYGEGEIMSYVLANSKLMRNETSFCKVTGRVILFNIDAMLKYTSSSFNYFQVIGLNPFIESKRVDTRFYCCTKRTFENYLLESNDLVNDEKGCYLEHVYYNQLNTNNIGFKDFKRLLYFTGVSGSTGESYLIKKNKWMLLNGIHFITKIIGLR